MREIEIVVCPAGDQSDFRRYGIIEFGQKAGKRTMMGHDQCISLNRQTGTEYLLQGGTLRITAQQRQPLPVSDQPDHQ